VGDFKNAGRTWRPKGQPVPVQVHDFLWMSIGKAVPYGIYDVARNRGFVNVHWRGQPLADYQTVVSLIGTTTTTGLTVTARLDVDQYPTGVIVSDAEMASLALQPHATHPRWNYTLSPRPSPQT